MTEQLSRSFEVTAPPGGDSDLAVAALYALAKTAGLHVQETTGLERPQPLNIPDATITQQGLRRVSEKLWDDPNPGFFAYSMLDERRKTAAETCKIVERNERVYVINRAGLTYLNGEAGPESLRPEDLDKRVIALLDSQQLPFAWGLSRQVSRGSLAMGMVLEDERLVRQAVALEFTAAKVRGYVQANGYERHGLHEGIGQALDVLLSAAGFVVDPKHQNREWPGNFMTRGALHQAMIEEPFTKNQIALLDEKISYAVQEQALSGRPLRAGEVIVRSSHHARWEEIAVESLDVIAGLYRSNSWVAPFLTSLKKELS